MSSPRRNIFQSVRQFSSRRLSHLALQRSYTHDPSPTAQLIQERDDARREVSEQTEKLNAVFRAFELTSRIAAMDSASYYRSQVGRDYNNNNSSNSNNSNNNTHWDSDGNSTINNNNSENPSKPQRRIRRNDSIKTKHYHSDSAQLDALMREWKFEATPLAHLVSSLHRLQSNLFHTHTEADTAVTQAQRFQDDAKVYNQRIRKLEKALRNLSRDNSVLRNALEATTVELEDCKRERDGLLRRIKKEEEEREQKLMNEAENRMSLLVEEHEKIMRDSMQTDPSLLVDPSHPPPPPPPPPPTSSPPPLVVAEDLVCEWMNGTTNNFISRETSRDDGSTSTITTITTTTIPSSGGTGISRTVSNEHDTTLNSDQTITNINNTSSLVTVEGTATLHFHPRFPTPKIAQKKKRKKEPKAVVNLPLENENGDSVSHRRGSSGGGATKKFIDVLDFMKAKKKKIVLQHRG